MIHLNEEKLSTEDLRRLGVEALYMFGSVARGTEGPYSDVDIAVLFNPHILLNVQREHERELAELIARAFNMPRVDIVNIAQSSNPVLLHAVVMKGVPLFLTNNRVRFSLERQVRNAYEDTRYLRKRMHENIQRHSKAGTLGKAPLSARETRYFKHHAHR